MLRAVWILVGALSAAGCGQAAHLHLMRGREHLGTPRGARTDKAAEAHATAAAAIAPPSCDDVKVKAYNHQVCCANVKDVVEPETLETLAETIRGTRGPLRVVANSHTSNEQICTDGVGISMANFNRIHGFKRHNGVEYVDVDAGVRMSELNRWLYEHGRSIGYTTIGYRGISIGGGLATAAHGSSLRHPSVLSSRLEYAQLVDAKGEVHELWKPPAVPQASTARLRQAVFDPNAPTVDKYAGDRERFRALSASVGMLGVITRVGLRVEPRFNLDVNVEFIGDDVLFKKGVEKLVGDCDWGQLVWFPRAARFMKVCGMRTMDEAQPSASNSLLAPHVDAGAIGAFKELMEDTVANGAYFCFIESERYSQLKMYPPFVHDCCCKKKYDRHVIGPADLMMSSELTEHQQQLAEIDYEIAIPLSEVPKALERVRAYAKDNRLCMPLIGAFLRFSPVDGTTLIGHSVTDEQAFKGEKVMFLEFVVYVLHEPETERERAQQERDYYGKYRELAMQLVEYHHGRPHWAKNQTELFAKHREVDLAYAERLKKFQCWVHKYDPDNRFANAFTSRVGLTPRQSTSYADCATTSDAKPDDE
ncbi:MAG: FAD-dependent oxidoreductase [Myxococcales bacterium]|nr:FAD-dependent oxidoreductase [Myxococcales bacterium]